ncbi:S-layer protein [uncultured archaeon]|nr:S-layer protein [uncultured archaeon]
MAIVTVTQASVSISPENISLLPEGNQKFTPTVTNTDNTAVTWSMAEGIEGGTITDAGTQIAVKKAMAAGERWDLGEGWLLTINSIDARATPRQVWLSLSRNGTKVDDKVMVQGQTYQYNNIIVAQIDSVFAGATTDMVQFTGVTTNLTGTVFYTAPITPGTYHIVATSAADTTKTATATVTVTPAISVSIDPASTTLEINKGIQFNASVTGTNNTAVTWSITGGSINTTGLYVATALGTYQVTATSVADTGKKATATVTVVPAISVIIDPASTTLEINKGIQFNARVTGTNNTAVKWSVQEIGGGSINTTGLYTAPSKSGTYHVIATSVADSTKTAIATITVTSVAKLASEKGADKLATKETDKIAEKHAKERETVTPIMNLGSISTLNGSSTLDVASGGRAFILPEERPDIGAITQPK